ncbi:helix-turn-helix domain-containing protein [Rhodoligotrophos defluvii]|uniref:helix-turn-helix domain-containing protein n=1 Tax=Rhodoligotrophos defluvii TaxID=2561934 RepID=UPI0010C9DB4A
MAHPTYIREWREFRGLKQQTVAEITGLSRSTISMMETGKVGYTQHSLEAIARALHTEPGYLLLHDPRADRPFWKRWLELSAEQRDQLASSARRHILRLAVKAPRPNRPL